MPSKTTSVLTVAGITALALVSYAVFFDYKRRNDVEFRRKLRKEKKRVEKTKASAAVEESVVSTDALRDALEQVKQEVVPDSPEMKEQYFMSQVASGEQLALQGPDLHIPAALCFFRALRVYPSPVELMVIYQKTVPEPIFSLVIQLTNLDTVDKIEGYYSAFPPKGMHVAIRPSGEDKLKKILVATKDIAAGELIYSEHPVVAALDADIRGAKTHCAQCMRPMDPASAVELPSDPLSSVYCSSDCQERAKNQHHNLLFSLEPLDIPQPNGDVAQPPTAETLESRRKVQTEFAEYLQAKDGNASLLAARLVARQITAELKAFIPSMATDTGKDFTDAEGTTAYALGDHLERLRFIDVPDVSQCSEKFGPVLEAAIPTLSSYVVDEKFSQLLGKMVYNAYGVVFGAGRDDKPASAVPTEDVERTRTPHGTSQQIGSAVYTVSSYLNHSCTPTVVPTFNGSEIQITAINDLKEGDELTVAFVDVAQHEGESVAECRRRRRYELVRGWKFACGCTRCREEVDSSNTSAADELAGVKDESKIEKAHESYAINLPVEGEVE